MVHIMERKLYEEMWEYRGAITDNTIKSRSPEFDDDLVREQRLGLVQDIDGFLREHMDGYAEHLKGRGVASRNLATIIDKLPNSLIDMLGAMGHGYMSAESHGLSDAVSYRGVSPISYETFANLSNVASCFTTHDGSSEGAVVNQACEYAMAVEGYAEDGKRIEQMARHVDKDGVSFESIRLDAETSYHGDQRYSLVAAINDFYAEHDPSYDGDYVSTGRALDSDPLGVAKRLRGFEPEIVREIDTDRLSKDGPDMPLELDPTLPGEFEKSAVERKVKFPSLGDLRSRAREGERARNRRPIDFGDDGSREDDGLSM